MTASDVERKAHFDALAATAGCVYFEHGGFCHEAPAGVLEWEPPDADWPMCDRHLQPEYHPERLHEHLKRWTSELGAAP